jgi:hypothetical protein
MAQLVGQLCVVCQKTIGWVGDSHFCRACESPAHNACAAAAAATQTAQHQCRLCGAQVRPLANPGVIAYWLIRVGDQTQSKWVLEWDETQFALKDPTGQVRVQLDIACAHRAVEFDKLYAEGTICFPTPEGTLVFERNVGATKSLRKLVAAGLESDGEYRTYLERRALRNVFLGLVMFVVSAGLFGLYCWFASWAPDPPPGHWIEWLGGLIKLALSALLGLAAGGVTVAYNGLRRWRLVRRVGRGPSLR